MTKIQLLEKALENLKGGSLWFGACGTSGGCCAEGFAESIDIVLDEEEYLYLISERMQHALPKKIESRAKAVDVDAECETATIAATQGDDYGNDPDISFFRDNGLPSELDNIMELIDNSGSLDENDWNYALFGISYDKDVEDEWGDIEGADETDLKVKLVKAIVGDEYTFQVDNPNCFDGLEDYVVKLTTRQIRGLLVSELGLPASRLKGIKYSKFDGENVLDRIKKKYKKKLDPYANYRYSWEIPDEFYEYLDAWAELLDGILEETVTEETLSTSLEEISEIDF